MNNLFYNPKIRIHTRTGEQAYKDYLARTRNETKSSVKRKKQAKPGIPVNPGIFSLEDLTNFWRITPVNYRDGIYQVELGKELLENKAQKIQDEWINYTKDAISKGEFYAGDMQLYHALFQVLFKNKDNAQFKDNIEQARQFLQKMFKDYWLATLTRVRYTKQGKDLVTHNYGLQDKLEIEGDIIGAEGYITQINPVNELNAVLGNNDINSINQVYNWITGKNAYLWRINNKPKEDTERVVWFSSGSDWSYLDCSGNPSYSDRVLAVRAKKF